MAKKGKKRRDKERDPSTLQRLGRTSVTALAVGAGAVFLNRNRTTSKLINDVASPLLKDVKGFKRDLIGRDKTNLMTYYNAYKKHFGKDLSKLKSDIATRKINPISVNINTSKALRDALEHKQFTAKKVLKH